MATQTQNQLANLLANEEIVYDSDAKLVAELLIANNIITSEDDFSKITDYPTQMCIRVADNDADMIQYLEYECQYDSSDIEYFMANHKRLDNDQIAVYIW